jgi:hypothetical protein
MSKNDRNALIEVMQRSFATKDDLRNFATKDDLRNFATKDDLRNFATKDDFKSFATKLELANMRGELRTEIANVKSDVIRWVFAFFVTMLLAILGLYFKK